MNYKFYPKMKKKKTSDIKKSRAFSTLRWGRLLNREGAAVPSDPPRNLEGRCLVTQAIFLPSFLPSIYPFIAIWQFVQARVGKDLLR